MTGKTIFFQLFLFFISTVAAAQILNPIIPNRILPPTDAFHIPNYPLPQAQTDEILSPFFRGEYLHNPGLTPPSLHGLYELPIGTQFNFTNSNYNSPQFQPQVNSYYDIYIQSLPAAYAPYHRELMEGQNFKVSGRTLSRTRYNSKNSSRQATRPVQVISSKAAQVRAAEDRKKTQAGVCKDCKTQQSKNRKTISDVQLAAVRNRVLKENSVPRGAFDKAWSYFNQNKDRIDNQEYMTVVDYTKPAHVPRLFLINLDTGSVERHLVSHGENSSGKGVRSSYAVQYSNQMGTLKSSHGAFLTGETYHGKFGHSLKVDGQQRGINDKARARTIVIHPWNVSKNRAQDTWGCFGLDPKVSKQIIEKTKDGSLWYVEPYRS